MVVVVVVVVAAKDGGRGAGVDRVLGGGLAAVPAKMRVGERGECGRGGWAPRDLGDAAGRREDAVVVVVQWEWEWE